MRIRWWAGLAACTVIAVRAPGNAAPDAGAGQVSLTAGDALSPRQVAAVAALARATALVRYLHPSDQAAGLDWDAFLPAAIDRVLRAGDPEALAAELRATFAAVAPTAVFSIAGAPAPRVRPPRGATHLVRWRRYGPGLPSPYPSFREGRDDESDVTVSELIGAELPGLAQCGNLRASAVVRRRDATGTVDLVVRLLRGGQDESLTLWPVTRNGPVVMGVPVSPDTQAVEVGLQVDGRAGATLEALSLRCASGAAVAISPAAPGWHTVGPTDLYAWRLGRCAAGPCATLARNPLDRALVPERDLLAADLGSEIRVDLPLAVWTDGARTLPAGGPAASAPPSALPSARSLRLAAVAAAWGTLATFYPYATSNEPRDATRGGVNRPALPGEPPAGGKIGPLSIDWAAALGPALTEAGAAHDDDALRAALRHLLVELQDGHARLIGANDGWTGVLPLSLRRFGDRVVVTGGAAASLSGVEPGAELVAIDDAPARAAYNRIADQVSAATAGLRGHLASTYLGAGEPGQLRWLRLRVPDGDELDRVVSLVPTARHDHTMRPVRPWTDTELTPGVIYVDFDHLVPETWTAMLPGLARARALIFDFRGYSTTGLVAVSHLIDRPVEQLVWQIPELPDGGDAPVHRRQYPLAPRLTAPVVALVDGQSASTVETTLAMIRDHHLGVLVGETTSGTSGLISTFTVPGGYTIRFTAVRLVDAAGATLHGRGITPDLIVHPTLDGVRAGRDEILEAGLAEALRLAPAPRASTVRARISP
jgi:hypothetical protein